MLATVIDRTSKLPAIGTEESEYLDFKIEPWASSDGGSVELARDVAQFANHLGGSIVLGATTERDKLTSYSSMSDIERIEARIMDVCHSRLAPRVDVACAAVDLPGGGQVLVVNARASESAVGVRVTSGRWDFYRRYGKGKKPMEFSEVEQMWSEGRRGRILLSRVTDLRDVYVDAPNIDARLAKERWRLQRHSDHLELTRSGGRFYLFPYEFVRAVSPRAGGGWSVALAVRFFRDPESGDYLTSHVL